MSTESLLNIRTSRYRGEKTLIFAVYGFISLATIWWVASTRNVENALGASATFETVGPLESPTFFIKNESGSSWSNVRIAVDKRYLYKTETVAEDETIVLRPDDFRYFYFVPRPWGRTSWETVTKKKKPTKAGSEKLQPKLIEIRADQGSHQASF